MLQGAFWLLMAAEKTGSNTKYLVYRAITKEHTIQKQANISTNINGILRQAREAYYVEYELSKFKRINSKTSGIWGRKFST